MYYGRHKLGDAVRIDLNVKEALAPNAPDAAVAFDLYSAGATSKLNRLFSARMGLADFYRQPSRFTYLLRLGRNVGIRSGVVTAATNASPIVVTSAAHGLQNGQEITIWGAKGNAAANGRWIVANKTTDAFELSGSTGDGTYAGGGVWNMTGMFFLNFRWVETTARGTTGFLEVLPGGNMDGTAISMAYMRPNLERNTVLVQTDEGLIVGLRNPRAPG